MTNTQVSKLRKAFANNYSANIKLSKTQLHKIIQSWEPLLKTGLPLIENKLKPLGLIAASAADAAVYKKIFGSGFTTLIISNKEMNNIMKIVKSWRIRFSNKKN